MPARVPTTDYQSNYNCWGFTANYLQWEADALWLEGHKMETYLRDRTTPISRADVQAGDIAVFRSGKYLTHTAIMLPGGTTVCHKPGSCSLCIDTLEEASMSYGTVTYARVIKNSEKEFDKREECVNV
jgi:hypothetical protein